MIPCYHLDLLDARLHPRSSPNWGDVRMVVGVWIVAVLVYGGYWLWMVGL